MSSDLLAPPTPGGPEPERALGSSPAPAPRAASAPEPARVSRKRRAPIAKPWFMRTHRWVSLVFGFVILLECVSGAVLVMRPELMQVGESTRYTVTPSERPLDAIQALRLVQEQRPDLQAISARMTNDVWRISGDDDEGFTQSAFVDPGTGVINDVGEEDPGYLQFMDQVHECFFACDDLPGYVPVMAKTMPGGMEVAEFVLGLMGVVLVFLCLSGIWIWWPTIRKFSTGFKVRRGRGSYVRDVDLHKVVGIISIPFLLMWGVSGMNFEYQWPAKAYYAVLPGSEPVNVNEDDLEPGTGPFLKFREAEAIAVARHPEGRIVGVDAYEPKEEGGYYEFRIVDGYDIESYGSSPGNVEVKIDSHGGWVIDEGNPSGPITTKYWESWQDGLHFGFLVHWFPRLFTFFLFGILPVLLGVTGITIWLVKWRSRRNRAARKRRDADEERLRAGALESAAP